MKFQNALLITLTALLLAACVNEKDRQYSEIRKMEKELFKDTEIRNDSMARILVKSLENYANTYKDDKEAPELLFRAAEISSGLGAYKNAIRDYQQIYLNHPNYVRAPESMFLCGFIYENNLADLEEARYYYKAFSRKYPMHSLRKDADAALANLGKDPAELVKEFEEKNKESK